MSEILERINALTEERLELFRQGAGTLLPPEDRARMKALSEEIAHLWDEHRRLGHPPAVPPVPEDWERPRRGRKPKPRPDDIAA